MYSKRDSSFVGFFSDCRGTPRGLAARCAIPLPQRNASLMENPSPEEVFPGQPSANAVCGEHVARRALGARSADVLYRDAVCARSPLFENRIARLSCPRMPEDARFWRFVSTAR